MDTYMDLYIKYLQEKRKMSDNTLSAYQRDVREFHRHLGERGITDVEDITNSDVVSYIMKLKNKGRTGSTINRKMASLRSYTSFLHNEGIISVNPSQDIKPPKVDRKEVEYFTIEEVERILNAPDDSVKGLRDKAILEMIYGTGIRVTEITELRMNSVNFRIGFITCSGEFGRARIIPLGRPCRMALENYVDNSREVLLKGKLESDNADGEVFEEEIYNGEESDNRTFQKLEVGGSAPGKEEDSSYVFVNYHGEKLTRQGLWKIVRTYAKKAGINKNLTPQILRNSFAVHMVQNGADLKSIQELMGYEDFTTAQAYVSVTKNRIKEVYDRTHPRA